MADSQGFDGQGFESQIYEPPPTPPPGADFSLATLIVTFLVFILILSLALWTVRRINRQGFRGGDSTWLRILDRQILSGQQSLYLVEIAGKIQVLGATDHHVAAIAEIEDPELAAEILEEIARRPEDRVDKLFGFLRPKERQRRGGSQSEDFSEELERLLQEDERQQ